MKQVSPAPEKEQELNLNLGGLDISTTFTEITKTEAKSQRDAILKHLQKGQSLSTLFAREYLGIMHPAARIMELRRMGNNILLHWVHENDMTGKEHRVGHYVLHSGEPEEAS